MKHVWSASGVVVSLVAVIYAAENAKPVQTILNKYAEAVEKADQARTTAIDKAADSAITQLARVATKAKSDKDPLIEANAWKTILKLDDSQEKARKYFTDLDQLDKVLEEVVAEGDMATRSPTLTGRWNIHYSDRAFATMAIRPDGTATYIVDKEGPKACALAQNGNTIIVKIPESRVVERWTLVGKKMFVEHWHPSSLFDEGQEFNIFAYAVKEK